MATAEPQDPMVCLSWNEEDPQGQWHQMNWGPGMDARKAVMQRLQALGGMPMPEDPEHAVRFARPVSLLACHGQLYARHTCWAARGAWLVHGTMHVGL